MKYKVDKLEKHMGMHQGDMEDSPMKLGHSYVPWQFYDTAFNPQEALMKGTLFPELYGVYMIPK